MTSADLPEETFRLGDCARWGLEEHLAQYVDAEEILACAAFEPDYPSVFGSLGPLAAIDMVLGFIAVGNAGGAKHSLWVIAADELTVLTITGGAKKRRITGLIGRWPLVAVNGERVVKRFSLFVSLPAMRIHTPKETFKVRAEFPGDASEAVMRVLCDRQSPH